MISGLTRFTAPLVSFPASSPPSSCFCGPTRGGIFLALSLVGIPFALALAAAFAWLLAFQPRQLLIIPFVLVGWVCALLVCTLLGVHLWWGGPFVAGGIGALITALGIPLATRRRLARYSYLAIMLTGALVAGVWGTLSHAHAYYWYERSSLGRRLLRWQWDDICFTRLVTSFSSLVSCPSTDRMTSPSLRPTVAAGLLARTRSTLAPSQVLAQLGVWRASKCPRSR
jgi:hypothetical protein